MKSNRAKKQTTENTEITEKGDKKNSFKIFLEGIFLLCVLQCSLWLLFFVFCLSREAIFSRMAFPSYGRVAEWPNASVSKTDLPAMVTGVRIPSLPN